MWLIFLHSISVSFKNFMSSITGFFSFVSKNLIFPTRHQTFFSFLLVHLKTRLWRQSGQKELSPNFPKLSICTTLFTIILWCQTRFYIRFYFFAKLASWLSQNYEYGLNPFCPDGRHMISTVEFESSHCVLIHHEILLFVHQKVRIFESNVQSKNEQY
jgi:hypothetical protein